ARPGGPVRRDRDANRWRYHRPGRRAASGDRPRADRRAAGRSASAEEGRFPHPRRAGEGAQEVRPEEGPQGTPVLQALTGRRALGLFGTDGVRGLANAELTPELALALAGAAARVLIAQ